MLVRWLLCCFLVLNLGGCLVTTHQHFPAGSAESIPLRPGIYGCVADTTAMPNREGRPPPSVLTNDSMLALFFKSFIVENMADSERRVLFGTDGGAHVFAFHRVKGDVYAASFAAKDRDVYHTWFFRIAENKLSLLFIREVGLLEPIAEKTGVSLSRDLPLAPNIRGTQEQERAFIVAAVDSGALVPASHCQHMK